MRILLATNAYPPNFIGGAEIIVHSQAKALMSLGHSVEVFAGEAKAFGDHHELRREVYEGVPVNRISMLPRDYDPEFVNFAQPDVEDRFCEVLERFRPEVFHGHNLIGLSAALPHLARRAGARAVVTLHDHWGYCFKNTIIKHGTTICDDFSRCAECKSHIGDGSDRRIPIRFRKDFISLMLSEVDAFVSPSRYLANSYIKAGFPAEKMNVIWNGIDVERFGRVARKPGCGVLRVTYVGVLYPHKGVATFIEALAHLPAESRLEVNIVGEGGLRADLEREAVRIGRDRWVRFRGRVDHDRMEEMYAETDVLVLPSVWPENQPVSVTEAMACGIPAIVSDLGGVVELVEDGVTGDIARAGDASDLAAKIGLYLADAGRAGKSGKAARERMARFPTGRQAERLVGLYGAAFANRREALPPMRVAAVDADRVGPATAEAAETLGRDDGWKFVLKAWLPLEWRSRVGLAWTEASLRGWASIAAGLRGRARTFVEMRSGLLGTRALTWGAATFFSSAATAVALARKSRRTVQPDGAWE